MRTKFYDLETYDPKDPYKIRVEPCKKYCGGALCGYWFLIGYGDFVQGSGFTKEQAVNIAILLNKQRLNEK